MRLHSAPRIQRGLIRGHAAAALPAAAAVAILVLLASGTPAAMPAQGVAGVSTPVVPANGHAVSGSSAAATVESVGGAWSQVDPTADDAVHSLALSGSAIIGGTYYNGLFRVEGATTTQPPSASAPLAAIERDPGDPSSLIAGAWFEGVFVSADGGATWTADNDGLAAIDVYSLAFVGGDRFAGTSAGVFYRAPSAWEPRSSGLAARNVFALLSAPPSLYAGTEHGVYKSVDLGLTWQAASSGLGDVPVYALAQSGSRIVAGTERGIYHSDDGGATWTAANPGLGSIPVRALATMAAEPSVVFAATAEGPFMSQNAGDAWLKFDTGLSGEALKVLSFAVEGTNPETVYVGTGAGIWQNSYDPGADSDSDGWTDWAEAAFIGSDPLDGCADDFSHIALPVDFNNDKDISSVDLSAVASFIGKAVPPAEARTDIDPRDQPDQAINSGDLSQVAARIGQSC